MRLAILILIWQSGKKVHWVVQMFGNEVIERFSLTGQADHPN